MVDFHTHILPGIDDGASNMDVCSAMLRSEYEQGIGTVFLTPHFYPNEQNLDDLLISREIAYDKIINYIASSNDDNLRKLKFKLGAEVYYFPGISAAKQIVKARMDNTGCIMVEPPIGHFGDDMLDDIESIYPNLGLVPIIAHVDRYCEVLGDYSCFDALKGRKILVQCNASFFLKTATEQDALRFLREGRIHVLGSDCHNMESRVPNLGYAARAIREKGCGDDFDRLSENSDKLSLLSFNFPD